MAMLQQISTTDRQTSILIVGDEPQIDCHPERSEGSISISIEMLFGVYRECDKWA